MTYCGSRIKSGCAPYLWLLVGGVFPLSVLYAGVLVACEVVR